MAMVELEEKMNNKLNEVKGTLATIVLNMETMALNMETNKNESKEASKMKMKKQSRMFEKIFKKFDLELS